MDVPNSLKIHELWNVGWPGDHTHQMANMEPTNMTPRVECRGIRAGMSTTILKVGWAVGT